MHLRIDLYVLHICTPANNGLCKLSIAYCEQYNGAIVVQIVDERSLLMRGYEGVVNGWTETEILFDETGTENFLSLQS